MSDTIIVFSTYFLPPFNENCLFNTNSIEGQNPISGDLLEYFWGLLKGEKTPNVWNNILSSLSERGKTDIADYLDKKLNNKEVEMGKLTMEIKKMIQAENLPIDFSNSNWLDDFITDLEESDDECLINKFHDLKDNYYRISESNRDNLTIDYLKQKKSEWFIDNLECEGHQNAYDIHFPSGYNSDSERCKGLPWLYNRFSYYKLKNSDDNISVFAVWPLAKESDKEDSEYTWIKALKKQFARKDGKCRKLYLILHDKDIETTPFKVFWPQEKDASVSPITILFQHKNDNVIGKLLIKSGTSPITLNNHIEKCLWEEGMSELTVLLSLNKITDCEKLLDNCRYFSMYSDDVVQINNLIKDIKGTEDKKTKKEVKNKIKVFIDNRLEDLRNDK